MKHTLPLFVFIDACGWEIIKNDPFAQTFAPLRKKLESVFGYSSACVPSILSGRWPSEHRNWSYFVYDPARSPFKKLGWLKLIPKAISSRRIFRRQVSKLIKKRLNFNGYFDIYNIPFKNIGTYDFTEKKSPLQPKGMNAGPNIFDFLEERQIAYHVSNPQLGEEENLSALIGDIESERIDFAFLYWPGLDALLHRVGNQSPEIPPKLRAYEHWIDRLLSVARSHYRDVPLYVFSDHGMANCDEVIDLRSRIDELPVKAGIDYAVVYDSTMARFWFFSDVARTEISKSLEGVPQGRILSDQELSQLGTYFSDRYFGELIFLLREGTLIVPSDMGERPIRAMHGYHPSDPHSYAAICTNQDSIPDEIRAIPDVFKLMTASAIEAKANNISELAVSRGEKSVEAHNRPAEEERVSLTGSSSQR